MPKEAKKSPVVVSVINLKGGVGKTTVTALLSRYAARMDLSVLAVDLDPQANLSQALMTGNDYKRFMSKREPSIVELFDGYLPPSDDRSAPAPLDRVMRRVGYGDNLHLIPSRFDFSDNLVRSVSVDEKVLAKFIARNQKDKDLILIDCAPTESIITRTAYHASRYILLPVRTEFFSTIGFPLLKQSLDRFKLEHPGHALGVCGVLINNSESTWSPRGPHHQDAWDDIKKQAKKYDWPVMKHQMFHSRGYPKLMREEYPTRTGNAEPEFKKITKEFVKLLKLSLEET